MSSNEVALSRLRYLEYGVPWNEIDEQDWPAVGTIYICIDPQQRDYGPKWTVSRMGDGTLVGDTTRLGLFWELKYARMFANAYCEENQS